MSGDALVMAMARVALFLDRSKRIIDEAREKEPKRVTLRTVEASELDVTAVHTICVELVRLRELERMMSIPLAKAVRP